MATETFYETKKSCLSGGGRIVYIPKAWGFEPGEIVKFSAYPISRPKEVVNLYKKVCATGNGSQGIYIDRNWGFPDDEFIVFSITKTDKGFI